LLDMTNCRVFRVDSSSAEGEQDHQLSPGTLKPVLDLLERKRPRPLKADSSERRNTEVSEVVVGAVRKTRRGVMWVEKQEWFIRLIRQGVSNAEACRIVGINRKTGTRWRYGRTIRNTAGEAVHYPPVRLTTPTVPHSRYLSITERTTIADLHDAGVGVRGIAAELGRSASTVSRELRRNTDGRGRYLPATAQRLSAER
jgi:Helix-turn-helix domain